MSEDLMSVETLERLSRQDGVDVRPILIRVLTDLFIQKPHHAPEEFARFEELSLQLLEVVDLGTRGIVARKLAGEPRAPRAVIDRLLADDVSVSAPLIARFPDIPREKLLTLALDGGAVEAGAVAARADIDADMIRILAGHEDALVLETLVANPAVSPSEGTLASIVARGVYDKALAAALLRREDFDAAAMAPLYLHAEPERRNAIRDAVAGRPPRSAFAMRTIRDAAALTAALEAVTTSSGRGHLITEALGDVLSLKPADAARLAAEPSGEPFVLMMRAAGMDQNAVARALLICQPEIAESVVRFFELVDVVAAVSRVAAAELLAALTGEETRFRAARHEPVFDSSGVPERAGAARAAPAGRRTRIRTGEAQRQRG